MITATVNAGIIDRLIDWRKDDPRFSNRRTPMQAQYTMELRFDALSEEQHEAMRGFMQDLAVFAYGAAQLLSRTKPKVIMYSDHSFLGHDEIPLLGDNMGKGLIELLKKMGIDPQAAQTVAVEPELMEAFTDHAKQTVAR